MKVLIICSCFAPKNVIGAVRLTKIAKYLKRKGCDITVVSPELISTDLIDDSLECAEIKTIKRIVIPYSNLTTNLTRIYKHSQGKKTKETKSVGGGQYSNISLARVLFSLYRDWEWSHAAINVCKKLDSDYDIVLSSSPLVATHTVANYMRKRKKCSFWIADFRDPIVLESSSGLIRVIQKYKQSKVVRNADSVSNVTPSEDNSFYCRKQDREKVVLIPNGFDVDDFQQLLETNISPAEDKLILSYTGGLFNGERDLRPLFKAISRLINLGEVNHREIEFHYAGKEFDVAYAQASEEGVQSILIDEGYITRRQAMELQCKSDGVVVATFCYRDGAGAMPGKVYEPVMLNKPVIMLVSGSGKNSEAVSFINRLDAGCTYEASTDGDNINAIIEYLQDMLQQKKKNGKVEGKIKHEMLKKYSYETLVDSILNLFNMNYKKENK